VAVQSASQPEQSLAGWTPEQAEAEAELEAALAKLFGGG
jgi:hypothetical protein